MSRHEVLDPRTHIETPENVRLTYHLAGPGSRAGAYLLDLALRWFILTGLIMFLGLAFPFIGISGLPIGMYLIGLFLVEWGYGCLFEGLWNGLTPGKRAFNLRVVKTEGYPIGFYEAILRNFLRVADILPLLYGVGFITTLCNRRMQRIGDLVAGTMVIREQRPFLRSELPTLQNVQPLPQSSFRNAFRPSERTLDVIDGLFRRSHELGPGRVDEIARILADPLARRLEDSKDRTEARRHPGLFLLRILATFQTPPARSVAPSPYDTEPPKLQAVS
jgi:uncharacterized RDD family membrane protein YckC